MQLTKSEEARLRRIFVADDWSHLGACISQIAKSNRASASAWPEWRIASHFDPIEVDGLLAAAAADDALACARFLCEEAFKEGPWRDLDALHRRELDIGFQLLIVHLFANAIAASAFMQSGALDAEQHAKALRGRDQISPLVEIYALKDPLRVESAREFLLLSGQPGLSDLVERGIASARARVHRDEFDEVRDPGISDKPGPL